jgi:hypothetical protein
MTTEPLGSESRIPWRRGALILGAVATTVWIALLLLGVAGRGASALAGIASWIALVLSFGTTYLLTRMWAHAVYADDRQAVLGRRLSGAFEILVAVLVVLGLADVGIGPQLVVGYTAVACFLATLVLALPRPPSG